MRGHKANLPFLVSLLDLVMSLAAEIVYGLLLSGKPVGRNPAVKNNVLGLILPPSEPIQKRAAGIYLVSSFPFRVGRVRALEAAALASEPKATHNLMPLPLPLVSPGSPRNNCLEGSSSLP